MRLEITRRSDLATQALLQLSKSGTKLKSSDLATSIGTTPGFLSQAMTPLVNAGWVRSEPGPSGGYTVLISPEKLSILQIVEAIEGETDSGKCVLQNRPCRSAEPCALHRPWTNARTHLLKELASTPLSDLIEAD
ncbi:MAG TPA: Rrf2 family transcriptional regulator [Acidimicrobiaceae bacterium]|jgi:Rrf2 family iron-sulfur cluster assembly transcriptional regulator|nr:Rrf2 family transcriptional regulator [Acidimicrobiaceae bacterium]